jgi:hypothetical protein
MNIVEGSLYRLAKKYGLDVEYYEEGDLVIDEVTGTATSKVTKSPIKDCIRLPGLFARNNFGQFSFDTETTKFYVSRKNLKSLVIKKEGFLNTVSSRYDIIDIHNFNNDLILEVKELEGMFPNLLTDSMFNTLMLVVCNVS